MSFERIWNNRRRVREEQIEGINKRLNDMKKEGRYPNLEKRMKDERKGRQIIYEILYGHPYNEGEDGDGI